jgi:hypothetical protein
MEGTRNEDGEGEGIDLGDLHQAYKTSGQKIYSYFCAPAIYSRQFAEKVVSGI